MRQERACVFETNSSSTHSITICSEEEFAKFKNGETVLREYGDGDKFVPISDPAVQEEMEDGYEDEFKSFEKMGDSCYEYFEEHYTTAGGDKIVAFGQYGMDC